MLVFTEEEELFPFLLLLQFLPDHRFKQLFLVVPRLFVADEAQVLKQHFPAHNFSPQILINKSSNQQIIKSTNHQITKSSNHRIIESPNHRIIESSNHRIIKSTHR